MAKKEQSCGWHLLACILCFVLIPGAIAGFVYLIVISSISKDAVYSVTITGVAGLDLDLDPSFSSPAPVAAAMANYNLSLSPVVFNLTVRIDNSRERMGGVACVDRLSTAAVSYGDALLAGHGSVPEFCVGGGKVRERAARAWGRGVALPPFLRNQLAAGEAAVDVKVTTPAEGVFDGDSVLVFSGVKIVGGAPAPCREEEVYPQQQANPGTTG